MRAVQGALIVASSIQIILGFSQMWAICSRYFFSSQIDFFTLLVKAIIPIKWLHCFLYFRFFSPLGMAPVIALVGFGLFDRGFPVVLLPFFLILNLLLSKWNKMKIYTSCDVTHILFTIDSLNFYQVGRCVEIGIPMLILFIAFSQVLLLFFLLTGPILKIWWVASIEGMIYKDNHKC